MALLDEELTGEAFLTPRIRSAMGVIGLWMFVAGVLIAISFAVGVLISVYFVYEGATSRYDRLAMTSTALLTVVLNVVGLYMGVVLTQAGQSLRGYLQGKDMAYLEHSFVKQKWFWLIFGVINVLLFMGLALILIVVLIEILD